MKRFLITFALVVGAVGALPSARAQTPAAEQAKAKFEDGRKAFRLGQFDDAIKLWTDAYKLKDDPVYLYNIALAYRQKGDLEQTIFFFKSYLHGRPDAPNRDQVEQRIAEIQQLIDAKKKEQDKPPTGPADPNHPDQNPQVTAPPIVEDMPPPGKNMKIAGFATGGVGIALLATGIVFGIKASSAQSDINAAAAAHQPWTPELQSTDDSGRNAATLSPIFIGLGAAAVVTGGVLVYLGVHRDHVRATREQPHTEAAIVPNPGSGGGFFVVRGTF